MATLSTCKSILRHRWQIVFVFAFIFGAVLPVSTASSADKKNSAFDLRGTWDLSWKGARDTYTGTLKVSEKLDVNVFSGTITIINSKGEMVTQDATLHVDGTSITINCSNASKSPYYSDNFYVNLNGKVMTGHSVDSAGQMGSLITFKKR
ncbi:MAG: hypothetical protein ACLQJ7_08310 [Syntrophobacteraceae bacterium]